MVVNKKLVTVLCLVIVCGLGISRHAAAHQLQTDGNMAAILHIEPDDDPVVGEPQIFILYFEPVTEHFTLADCNCRLELIQNSQTVYAHALTATAPTISNNPYTFAKDGLYTLDVTGIPKHPGDFSAFKLIYSLHTEAAAGSNTFELKPATVAGLILLQVGALVGIYKFLRP